jgi:hypothetical protein
VIGISAVIAMVALSRGARQSEEDHRFAQHLLRGAGPSADPVRSRRPPIAAGSSWKTRRRSRIAAPC